MREHNSATVERARSFHLIGALTVTSEIKSVVGFLEEQRTRQASHFAAVACPKVLSFMTTTSQPGGVASVSIHPLLRLEPGASEGALRVHLAGALPRLPDPGECVTVHVARLEQYQGYQIKSLPAGPGVASAVSPEGAEQVVSGARTFTVHHSPYTMKFFEQIPYDEVQQIAADVAYALVGVGAQANISPRFVYHHELKNGRLSLFHGDGLAFKTYMNLKVNRQETRLLLDLETFAGWALRGTVEEFSPHQYPEAYDRVCQGFSAGNWGKPSRVFRFVTDQWTPIQPVAERAQRSS
jgi:hypothetical protein